MGLLDRLKSVGTSIVNTARNVEHTVANTATHAAESVSHAVTDGYDAAKKAAVDLGNGIAHTASVIPSKVAAGTSQVAHSWYNGINAAADAYGGAMKTAGSLMEAGGKKLEPYVPFAHDAVLLGEAAQVMGKGIADAPENAVAGATQLIHTGQEIVHEGEQFLVKAEHAGVEAAREGIQMVGQGVTAAKNAVTSFVSEVAHATDYRHNIEALGNGDKYRLALGGNASVEGIKAYGKGAVEVQRNEAGKYVVSVDGEVGAGVYGEVGGKLGAKLNAEAAATLGVGGKMEMTFDSAEEASRATEIILKQAAASASTAEANNVVPVVGGMVAGAISERALGPTPADMQFLANHTSAVELKGNVAADVAGCAGLKDVAGLFGSAGVKDEVGVRLEFRNAEGEQLPHPQLVVRQTVTGEANIGAGLKLSDGKGEEASGVKAAFVGGKGEAKLQVEQRFDLPGVSGADLLSHPLATVQAAAASMVKSEQDKITLGLDLSGQGFGNGGGVEATATYSGNFNDIRSTAIDALRRGDLGGAVRSVNAGEAELKVEPYSTIGVAFSPGVSLMGFGVGASFEATRKDVSEEHSFSAKGTPGELLKEFNAALQPYMPYTRASMPQQALRG